jgi:chitinase
MILNFISRRILSFLLTSGPADQVRAWTQLSAQERADILTLYHAQGISIMVSAFGSTDTPTTDGVDPVASAEAVAAFVKEFDLDGVDVDYEDAVALSNGKAVQWLTTFTKTLRAALPTDSLISHARKPSLSLFGYVYIN